MLELNVNPRTPAAINAAIKKVKEMTTTGTIAKGTPIHLILEAGLYRESVRYNLSNPLIIESATGTKPENCVIQADNCESYNPGLISRGIFTLGPNVTSATLKNFSIINTHNKSSEGNLEGDTAEALTWNNTTGKLTCEGLHIESRKNTLSLKGYSLFSNCYISGDTNFIYGEPHTALFEDSEIYAREDDRGDFSAYVVNSQAMAKGSGFIFSNCRFTGEERKQGEIFAVKTDGKGTSSSEKNWDNVAFINCTMSSFYNTELVFDDDMNLEVYPRGNAKSGIREYKPKIQDEETKEITEADTTRRNNKVYTLTDNDYFSSYASRYLILHDTPFNK